MYAILKECPLFRGLTAAQIEDILADKGKYALSEYRDGDLIAQRDTAYSGLMIAPAFLFGGYNKLPIDVIADGDVTIMTIHRGYIFELMQNNVVIMSNFVDILSNRANVWSKKIYYLSFRSLREKVANYLLDHTHADNSALLMPDIAETASYFDATRSALQTVLDEMAKKRLVRRDGDSVVVLNPQGLRDILK